MSGSKRNRVNLNVSVDHVQRQSYQTNPAIFELQKPSNPSSSQSNFSPMHRVERIETGSSYPRFRVPVTPLSATQLIGNNPGNTPPAPAVTYRQSVMIPATAAQSTINYSTVSTSSNVTFQDRVSGIPPSMNQPIINPSNTSSVTQLPLIPSPLTTSTVNSNSRSASPVARALTPASVASWGTHMLSDRLVAAMRPLLNNHLQSISDQIMTMKQPTEYTTLTQAAKDESQKQAKDILQTMSESFTKQQDGIDALSARMCKLEEVVGKNMDSDCHRDNFLVNRLNSISFVVTELLRRSNIAGISSESASKSIPSSRPSYIDIAVDTKDLSPQVNLPVLVERANSPISGVYLDASVSSGCSRQTTPIPVDRSKVTIDVTTSPFPSLYTSIGVETETTDPEVSLRYDVATSPIHSGSRSPTTEPRTPPLLEGESQILTMEATTTNTLDLPCLDTIDSLSYPDSVTLLNENSCLKAKSTGDLDDLIASPRLERKHVKFIQTQDESTNVTNIEGFQDSIIRDEEPSTSSGSDAEIPSWAASSSANSSSFSVLDPFSDETSLRMHLDEEILTDEDYFLPSRASPEITEGGPALEQQKDSFTENIQILVEQEVPVDTETAIIPATPPCPTVAPYDPRSPFPSESSHISQHLPASDSLSIPKKLDVEVSTVQPARTTDSDNGSELSVMRMIAYQDSPEKPVLKTEPQSSMGLHSPSKDKPLFLPESVTPVPIVVDYRDLSPVTPLSDSWTPMPRNSPITSTARRIVWSPSRSGSPGEQKGPKTPVMLKKAPTAKSPISIKKPSFPEVNQPKISLASASSSRNKPLSIIIPSSPIYISSDSSSPLTEIPDSDSDGPVAIVKRKKKKSAVVLSTATSSSTTADSAPPRVNLKEKLLNLKSGQSTAVTRVKKRKALDIKDVKKKEPPLKKARMRANLDKSSASAAQSAKTASASAINRKAKEKGKEAISKSGIGGGSTASKEKKNKSSIGGTVESRLRDRPVPTNFKWPKQSPSGNERFDHQFIQCDLCSAWYHYGCVGVVDATDVRIRAGELLTCPPCLKGYITTLEPVTGTEPVRCARPGCKVDVEAPDTYFMSALIGRCTVDENGTRQYKWLVKWDGYSIAECTWETEDGMSDPRSFIFHFKEKAQQEGYDPEKDLSSTILLQEAILGEWSIPRFACDCKQ